MGVVRAMKRFLFFVKATPFIFGWMDVYTYDICALLLAPFLT